MDICTGFQDDLTGVENVFISGALLGLSEYALRVALPEVEYFAELEGFMDTPIRYYSSGMKARLSFAVAMNANPDIFLIDEVLAVGDEGFRAKCHTKLDNLVERGRTIIMASHDTYSVERLCRRAIWIDSGAVRMDGPTPVVVERYISNYCQTC
jgi:ABC-type polysaccharide/polyol phosphate transport system ATPase subunit